MTSQCAAGGSGVRSGGQLCPCAGKTRGQTSVGLMLGQHLRRWTNIKPTRGWGLVLPEKISQKACDDRWWSDLWRRGHHVGDGKYHGKMAGEKLDLIYTARSYYATHRWSSYKTYMRILLYVSFNTMHLFKVPDNIVVNKWQFLDNEFM